MNGRRVVFLDKDGTLIDNVPYNVDPRWIRLAKGAALGTRLLHRAGFELVVVTNQAGIALGKFPEQAMADVEQRVRSLLLADRVALSGFYYCPHHPQGIEPHYTRRCQCRKPLPGLLQQATDAGPIDFERSWLIGDTLDDIEAGSRLGCRTVLIDNGGETVWQSGPYRQPTEIVASFADAAATILTHDDTLTLSLSDAEMAR